MSSSAISRALAQHYTSTFERHGAVSQGVDWGADPRDHLLRLDQMLSVMSRGRVGHEATLLDVGCGFGSLLDRAKQLTIPLDYSGIDLCEPMIEIARANHPEASWFVGDILDDQMERRYDYVVCNGILTQKLGASIRDMDQFLKQLVRKMFAICDIGVAFNVMTSRVNFMVPNLYYRSPAELLAWCMDEVTTKVTLDHAYPLYEFTVYLYRENVEGDGCRANAEGSAP